MRTCRLHPRVESTSEKTHASRWSRFWEWLHIADTTCESLFGLHTCQGFQRYGHLFWGVGLTCSFSVHESNKVKVCWPIVSTFSLQDLGVAFFIGSPWANIAEATKLQRLGWPVASFISHQQVKATRFPEQSQVVPFLSFTASSTTILWCRRYCRLRAMRNWRSRSSTRGWTWGSSTVCWELCCGTPQQIMCWWST